MNYNVRLLKFTWLSIGYYNFYDKKVYRSRLRVVINRFFEILNIFSALKLLCIVIIPNPTAIFYLNELHIMDSDVQKSFHTGLIFLHILTGYMYRYWANMNPKRLECLNHLFIPNINHLCQHYYDLDLELTRKFLKKAKNIALLIKLNMNCYQASFYSVLIRCLFISYLNLDLDQFLFISVPFFVITFVSYHCLIWCPLTVINFMFTTMEFLVLRARDVSEKISKLAEFDESPTDLRKKNSKIIKILNGFIVQHKKANSIFDDQISFNYVNVLISAFIFPYFIIVEQSVKIKIFLGIFYFIGVFGSVVIITIFNDQFIAKVR